MSDKSPASKDETDNICDSERKASILNLQGAINEGRSCGPAISCDPVLFKQKMRQADD